MKKKLLVVAMKAATLDVIQSCLEPVFGGYITLISKCIHEVSLEDLLRADLVMFSHQNVKNAVQELYRCTGNSIICQRAINYAELDKIFLLPPATNVYLINETQDTALAAIEELQAIGFNQFHFVPLYGPTGTVPIDRSITTGITLGPWPHQPPHLTHVVDIGYRIVSITTILELIIRLELPLTLASSMITGYNKHIARLLQLSTIQLSQSIRDQQIVRAVMDNMESGACLVCHPDTIHIANKNFYRLLLLPHQDISGRPLSQLLAENGFNANLDTILLGDCIRTNKNGVDLVISATEISKVEGRRCFLVSVSDGRNISKKETALRISKRSAQSSATYEFCDYISADPRILSMLERARRIAQRDSTVLIQGESGTGKEILAQAIHNASPRRNLPFVAVNFAGMQPELIESELFGYEDGAFTGAKRGGKHGLWEIAHEGTIFLDEVGDAPASLQVTLLRVLQEHEIRRVGGHERIPVNVRVIAATNKDLLSLVEAGQFREDLFYRLNTTPLDTIPLRERKGDLPLLFEHFIRGHFSAPFPDSSQLFSPELSRFFHQYDWPGNVREVSNICEYFSCVRLEGQWFTPQDLPSYMLKRLARDEPSFSSLELQVLTLIRRHPKIGRSRISQLLAQEGTIATDSTVRSILHTLAEKGYIRINRTRGGCEATAKTDAPPH